MAMSSIPADMPIRKKNKHQQPNGGHQRNEWNQYAIKEYRKEGNPSAAIVNNEPPGKRHRKKCPNGRGQQHKSYLSIGYLKLILYPRQTGKQVGMDKSIKKKNNVYSQA